MFYRSYKAKSILVATYTGNNIKPQIKPHNHYTGDVIKEYYVPICLHSTQ